MEAEYYSRNYKLIFHAHVYKPLLSYAAENSAI